MQTNLLPRNQILMTIGVLVKSALIKLVFGISVITAASAQTVYVATNGVDQASNGSLQQPWASIRYALGQVSDGATIMVAPGTYEGRVSLDQKFANGVVIRSSSAYQAKLRHDDGAVVICFTCAGITLEGFDIAHSPNNTGALVIQIQNSSVSRVVLRNNIIHDSTNNDLLKINNGARQVMVDGNLFYNQQGSDEHIDINSVEDVTVQNNVFFNSRSQSDTSSYIVIKDSNAASDGVLGAKNIKVQRNIFFNWLGNDAQSFVRVGEDGTANFEADGVDIENNLMLGNSDQLMRSAFTVQGSRNVRFRFNTVVGDLPSRSFAARLLVTGSNQANQNIELSNNIWSDPTGSLGQEAFNDADVFDAPQGDNASVNLANNVYYNGGNAIPADASQGVRFADDASPRVGNPLLPAQTGIILPVYAGAQFAGGYDSIRSVFEQLANRYGRPASGSIVRDQGLVLDAPEFDLLGARRDAQPDIGAVEIGATPPRITPIPKQVSLAWLLLLIDE
ncbi:hypothetical protein [Arenicella xantha]|nr:hypothetical protein [Arenicella xantha]